MEKAQPQPRQQLKILVIEDSPADIALFKRLLTNCSFSVAQLKFVESLRAAFDILEQDQFDIVLSDLNLPDSSGVDTIVALIQKHPYLPIVVITGKLKSHHRRCAGIFQKRRV